MIVPYAHLANLSELNESVTTEMMELAKKSEMLLREEYKPDGFNIGLNLGQSAGAGIAGHIHLHVVPRWSGDANFVSVIGETRILPEELSTTLKRLASKNWVLS
jgi:ATP adenylyltransferase